MKWVFLFSTLSIALFALIVFITSVHVRIQLALNRKQTFVSVSLGIINGLIWLTAYRSDAVTHLDQSGQGELLIGTLEDLIRHPENALELLWHFAGRLAGRELQHEVSDDNGEKSATPQDRFLLPVIRQALERGLDVVRLCVKLQFGTGEAATTGITIGLIYGLVGTAMAVFSKRLRFLDDPPDIKVVPCYNEVCVDLELDSIILLRPGNFVFRAIFGQDYR
jgi:hypothetical protein